VFIFKNNCIFIASRYFGDCSIAAVYESLTFEEMTKIILSLSISMNELLLLLYSP